MESVDSEDIRVVARRDRGLLEVAVSCSMKESSSRRRRVVEGGHGRGRGEKVGVSLRRDLEELNLGG